MSHELDVLFEDEHCLAVSKPAGQFTQGSWAPPGECTLEQAVRHHLDPSNPSSVYVGIVHRLDRPVSGVLIWAKNPRAARRLATQFERRQAAKEYWAIVASAVDSEAARNGGVPPWEPVGKLGYLVRLAPATRRSGRGADRVGRRPRRSPRHHSIPSGRFHGLAGRVLLDTALAGDRQDAPAPRAVRLARPADPGR